MPIQFKFKLQYGYGKQNFNKTILAKIEDKALSLLINDDGFYELKIKDSELSKPFCLDHCEMIDIRTKFPTHCQNHSIASWLEYCQNEPIFIIPRPIVINLKMGTTLHENELQYFKDNGNNALLFIHGYNSSFGRYGFYPEKYQLKRDLSITESHLQDQNERTFPQYVEFQPSRFQRTIRCDFNKSSELLSHFKDLTPLYDQFFGRYCPSKNPEGIGVEEAAWNGIEAHHWFTSMEYNFNIAAGLIPGKYENYTRMIGLHWPGDVGVFNFSKAKDNAKMFGENLARLIEQLNAHHITVNIVAHSLGSQLLLESIQYLAPKSIQHAILWQPAIPDFALSERENEINAMQKISILYSRDDGILQTLYRGYQLPRHPTYIAMGYHGPKKDSFIEKLIQEQKLLIVDQTNLLTGHSYMKVPTPMLMEKIYKQFVIGGKFGIKEFGLYNLGLAF